ncbi:PepSY-associated TM helix domain-containing protein [Sphingomonas sp. M1-B02]|uniref:PepSY-associated TM helix domain-containing protein n=1 Tax=Sphingomonas sp. M1-B02 TaxID=3114300 RepID=UPI00223F7749|nr:PepSY domain-containing protein [Sphingomonas sp. S6-11]UZK67450.1 PepSY domain-containing protein [Sphingomonas sp. S6-11]
MTTIAAGTPGALYRTIWRWHFYAGLFVLPFILILSVTGAIYLFKPQLDRWEERSFHGLATAGAVSPDVQLAAVTARFPAGRFNRYRVPEQAGDAAMIELGFADGANREIFVSPQGQLLGARDPDDKISETVARIHGSLLLGCLGDWLVELAASWTIVLILTGLYLWWPRPFRAAGTLYPRLSLRGRPLLKDVHRSTGFWIAGLVLVMLASGLPWAGAWGKAFQWARAELGLIEGVQDWKLGASAHHGPGMMVMPASPTASPGGLPLAQFVAKAQEERMAFPVLVTPPHAPQRFGPPTGAVWTVKSEAQNRPLTRQVTYDPMTGAEIGRSGFGDRHVIDRVVNTGIAWHEGQLFGWVNQLIGLLTAIALVTISLLGTLMWLKWRPRGSFGAPPKVDGVRIRWALLITIAMGILLPLFGLSLLILLALDKIRQLRLRRRRRR